MPRLTAAWALANQPGLAAPQTTAASIAKDPKVHDSAVGYQATNGELFGKRGPNAKDVLQGGLGDCYFLASVAAVVADDPAAIKNSIVDNRDGTYSVRFFKSSGKAVWVTVDSDLPVDKNGNLAYARAADADSDGKLELWVPILEKAYAAFKDKYGPNDGVSGYKDLARGGSASDAITALTGKASRFVPTPKSEAELADVLEAANDGREVVLSTKADANRGWVGNHAYTVLGTYERDGETMVRVRNPWGFAEPSQAVADGANDGTFDVPLRDLKAQINGVHSDAPFTIVSEIVSFIHHLFG